jgi:hypothetical protein
LPVVDGRRPDHRHRTVGRGPQRHRRLRRVVESLAVGDVLETDGVADSALQGLPAADVAGASRVGDRLASPSRLLGRQWGGPAALDHLPHRRRALEDLAGGEHRAGADGVPQPQLERIEPELRGELVHRALVGEADLRRAEAAHRAAGRVVRVDDRRLDEDVRHLVRPGCERGRVAEHGRRGGRIRTAVQQEAHVGGDESAVPRRAIPNPASGRVAVHVAVEGLLPAVDHLHGASGPEREEAGVDLHVDVLARAEGASDARERDPDHLLGQPETQGDLLAVDVQPLRRDVEVDAAVGGGHCETALGTERSLVLHRRLVVALDPDLGRGGGPVAVADVDVAQDVAELVHARRVGTKRLLHVGHRRQRLVLDRDEVRPAPRLVERLCRNDGDRLTRVSNDSVRKDGLVGEFEPEGAGGRQVGRGEHARDAGRPRSLGDVDPANARGRVRGANGDAPEHVLGPQIAPVRVGAGDLRKAVDPLRVLPHTAAAREDAHTGASSARWTAATIFE